MRRQHYLIHMQERINVLRQRFFRENVYRRSRDLSRLQSRRQCLNVQHGPARYIDNSHAPLHFSNFGRADHPSRFLGQRRM